MTSRLLAVALMGTREKAGDARTENGTPPREEGALP